MQANHPSLSSDSDAASDVDELSAIDLSLPGPNASPRTLRKVRIIILYQSKL